MTGLAPGFDGSGPCWVCGDESLVPYHQARLDLMIYREQDPELAAYSGTSVWLRRCASCGFGQPERLPSLPGFFDRMYDQHWSAEWIAQEFESPYKDRIFRRILASLRSRLPDSRRTLLDIGAHAGRFLHLARESGWTAEGLELNPRTAAYAEQRTGARVHRVNAEALAFQGSRFDAVTLTDVLEHIPHPVAMLSRARSVLAPGGWIAVKVPCGPVQRMKEEWLARLRRGYEPRLADNLVHVNHFSPGALTLALTRAGFEDATLEIGAPELPPDGKGANVARLAIFGLGRLLPLGVHTPLALNLQAFGRNPGVETGVSSRQSAVGSRQSAVSSRQSAVGSRQSAVCSQQSAVGSHGSAVRSQPGVRRLLKEPLSEATS